MYECTYCDLTFETKGGLSTHQKTKKCILHQTIGFFCKKCFKTIKGYDNTLKHTSECCENVSSDLGMITALINQLSVKYNVNLTLDDENNGTIKFEKAYTYVHPKKIEYGLNIPQKPFLFYKTLTKHTDDQILGSHHHYLNDIYNKISRLDEPFQFLSVKYGFEDLINNVFFNNGPHVPCFTIKEGIVHVLGKVQCENKEGQKWFGDTFNLKDDEKIVKCVWYADPELKQFYACLKPLLKDLLNCYLNLVGWALKQKKIKFKETTDLESKYKIISDIVVEYKFINLIDNIKKLDSYETFYSTFKKYLKNNDSKLHSNISHVFKDDLLPSSIVNEEYSLMIMSDPKFIGGNYHYLIDYILPESEKNIFRSKN